MIVDVHIVLEEGFLTVEAWPSKPGKKGRVTDFDAGKLGILDWSVNEELPETEDWLVYDTNTMSLANTISYLAGLIKGYSGGEVTESWLNLEDWFRQVVRNMQDYEWTYLQTV